MDIVMIVLRLLHIFAGVFWVGSGVFFSLMVIPALNNISTDTSGKFMEALFKHTRFSMFFPAMAGTTMLSGLILYYKVSDGFNTDWMTSTGGVVLTIGSVAGILAGIHGGASLGPAIEKYKELLGQGTTSTELKSVQDQLILHRNIGLVLLFVAVFGMASARYF